jgi:hypothetical protein
VPNGKAHAVFGTASGGVAAFCLALRDENGSPVVESVGGALGGYVGGRLPDWLEPSLGNPRHRSHCHSWAALGLDAGAAAKWLQKVQSDLRNRAHQHKERCTEVDDWPEAAWHWVLHALLMLASGLVAGLAAGVASHLVLDAGTKAGLQPL